MSTSTLWSRNNFYCLNTDIFEPVKLTGSNSNVGLSTALEAYHLLEPEIHLVHVTSRTYRHLLMSEKPLSFLNLPTFAELLA